MNKFHILGKMADENMDIQLAPLGNIISARKVSDHGEITIGVPTEVVIDMLKGKQWVGGPILADKKQFEKIENSNT